MDMHNLTDKTTVIASRCPECGAIIADRINVFSLSQQTHNIKCKICGKSSLSLQMNAEGKIRLSVPCLMCPHPHPYTLASTVFFTKELFLLQCSYSGLDICFIGNEDKVDEALRMSAKQLKELFDEQKHEEESQNFLDANVMQEVMYSLEELIITNRVRCNCGEPNLSIVVDYDKIHLSCKDCGCKKTVYASENEDIEKCSSLKKLILE